MDATQLQQRGAYLLPSGALIYAGPPAQLTSVEERAFRASFYAWVRTPEGAAWAAAQLRERAAAADAARASLTREWPRPVASTMATVLAEATERAGGQSREAA